MWLDSATMAHDDTDPGLVVNCPTCGDELLFVATRCESEEHLYVCKQDGLFLIADSRLAPMPLSE